jgi:CBS domain-containing protein
MRGQFGVLIALDGVRQVEGDVGGEPNGDRALLAATHLRCQKGGAERDALDCVPCERFINFRPSRDRATVTVRCQWSLDDPVADLMTLASALAIVGPDERIAAADELAQQLGIRHLVVMSGRDLLGVVCRCDLVPPVPEGETVGDRMASRLVVLPAHATLRNAAEVMTEFEVGCLPVMDPDGLRGVVTRGDLRRAGVEEAMLGATRCEACGSCHGVRAHPMLEAVEFCLDCLDRAMTPADYEELGTGD